MKILFLSSHVFGESVGGVEFHMYYLAKNLIKIGESVTILTPEISYENRVVTSTYNGIEIKKVLVKSRFRSLYSYLERKSGGGLSLLNGFIKILIYNLYWRKVLLTVKMFSPDLIHQHDYLSSIWLSKHLSKTYPIVFTNHKGEYLFLEKFFLTRFIQQLLIRHFLAIIAPSRELTPSTPNSYYLPNGVDFDVFYNESSTQKKIAFRRELGLENKIVFFCPRRWAPTKGVLYLAKALQLLPKEICNKAVFLFAGSDTFEFVEYREEVLAVLKAISDIDVRLLGNLEQHQLQEYYNVSDVVVIPSLMEATSLSALEAMACSVPVLSTNVGGMPEIVQPGFNGWLIPSADEESLAALIADIATDKFDLKSMGQNALEFVKNGYDWQIITEKVFSIYKKALKAYGKS